MRKPKPFLELYYESLPETVLTQPCYTENKVIVVGLISERVKVLLHDFLKGYDLERACDRHGTKIIMRKNNKLTGRFTLQTY